MYPNKYIPMLVKEYIADELADAEFYNSLTNMAEDIEDGSMLKETALEEEKHSRILTDIYEKLTGAEPSVPDMVSHELMPKLIDNIANAFKGELTAVEKYRPLMFALEDEQLRDYLYEIITDEQNHAARMNYLYSRLRKL